MDCNNEHCRERFEAIERRLDMKSQLIDQHQTDIEVLKTQMTSLTNSLHALTKALWGVAATIGATLISFFIWYVQTIRR